MKKEKEMRELPEAFVEINPPPSLRKNVITDRKKTLFISSHHRYSFNRCQFCRITNPLSKQVK